MHNTTLQSPPALLEGYGLENYFPRCDLVKSFNFTKIFAFNFPNDFKNDDFFDAIFLWVIGLSIHMLFN